jgi:hypothetical protein
MGLFKLRKNKKFNYEPRFYNGSVSPFKIKHKYEDERVTVEKANLKRTLTNAINDFKNRDQKSTKTIAIIVLILVFIFLFIIDFDLTIFFN